MLSAEWLTRTQILMMKVQLQLLLLCLGPALRVAAFDVLMVIGNDIVLYQIQ